MKITRQVLRTALKQLKRDAAKDGITMYLNNGVTAWQGQWSTYARFKSMYVTCDLLLDGGTLAVRLHYRNTLVWAWELHIASHKVQINNTGLDIVDA